MKKVKYLFWLLIIYTSPVLAKIDPPVNPNNNPLPTKTLPEIIYSISNSLTLLVGVIAILFIIIGGFQYITSAGNPDNIGKAKNTILYGIIGIIVVLCAWLIVKFVINSLIQTPASNNLQIVFLGYN
ncbi:hypothetical protein COX95_01625 [bacterium CG_4_10_14_0_2_um_filter_33_32]|nr:MAG: hypothetical protein AUJ93_03515 [bacterium CG2_30_33_46]PIR67931.1 MAG: hypothetical protein COU50_00710 [bacterium CG10_big_fil_rev_8_21_14_0_10_33_18]PIU76860.1 MAG: hypothetical protein COS74_01855 [bacterium CG06_land_8_20_14_3_00_33_50]PIW81562.1 MAG: hypothetical protein COZ97_01175 [bacterium CG_4_8_14_3_um_filter_33_28]PIY85385.1 MAG: hypothetical protein COY76_02410 [bacterium CG_4_10_14_0_8_um_filter_33_57]PIZ86328.1 MAG: hypothetical protein COX95_01625 [bacterium CG_4_10_1